MIKCLDDKESMEKCPDLLIRIQKKHIAMIETLRTFNTLVKFTSFTQLMTSTVIFLVLIFSIQFYKDIFIMHVLLFALGIQLALLCLFGELIRHQTEQIFQNLYLTNWYEMSLSDRKIVLMMMTNSCKAIGLKAAGMYDVSLVSVVQVSQISQTIDQEFSQVITQRQQQSVTSVQISKNFHSVQQNNNHHESFSSSEVSQTLAMSS
ncbi:uncharacterized protein LOC132256785 [Phlebotomus argentipes]|uniref:uncharacterized protein LOC132256785 n=1 Tax=Phlebotomus argentipes TaxID=94469 RepID=UPI0028936242|nr:uncharacterized protein LOC132256785 [Phlebotomus argentipes]